MLCAKTTVFCLFWFGFLFGDGCFCLVSYITTHKLQLSSLKTSVYMGWKMIRTNGQNNILFVIGLFLKGVAKSMDPPPPHPKKQPKSNYATKSNMWCGCVHFCNNVVRWCICNFYCKAWRKICCVALKWKNKNLSQSAYFLSICALLIACKKNFNSDV